MSNLTIADFEVVHGEGWVIFHPRTNAAVKWLRENASDKRLLEGALIDRHIFPLAQTIKNCGLTLNLTGLMH